MKRKDLTSRENVADAIIYNRLIINILMIKLIFDGIFVALKYIIKWSQ